MITEGGNVFKDSDGQPATQRINLADIKPTVQWLEQVTGLPLLDNMLGSTGLKPSSGDLDLAVDANKLGKEELYNHLAAYVKQNGQDPKQWVAKSGISVHFKTPIAGRADTGFVQTDFMFMNKPEFSKFILRTDPNSDYKGATRNILINSIGKAIGYKLNQNTGMMDRATNELVTDDPDRIAAILLGPGHTREDLGSVEKILAALKNDPKRDAKLADFKDHMSREGKPLDENVVYNDVFWLARLRDRIVNQGMQVIVEAEVERKDPRIPHPEDAFFLQGSAGAQRQIQGLEAAAANDKNITIKWDGKPALIFGRLPNGRLAVMDKYMFDAGYAAQSPEDWVRYDQQKASGKLRTDLYPKIQAIWPGLDAATQGSGFYWGDMLWSGELRPQAGEYKFKPNFVEYSIPADSETGRVIAGKTGGIVVHQQFANLGDKKAMPWSGKGLKNVPGGVAILTPTLGTRFQLSKPNLSAAKAAVKTYGAAVDEFLDGLPASIRQKLQTYFNQRITGGTTLDLPNWLKLNVSAKQYNDLVTGTVDAQGRQAPGKLFALKGKQLVPSAAYVGMNEIWNAIYSAKLAMAQQLEQQVQGLKQKSGASAEGEGFVVNTPQGLIKLVNRGVFSAGNRQLNNPT